ncbi:MAG: hypothetical protein HYX85_00365 [Chloroflexi bacterium]|nr:hypothetical protein [Chloroflexota bacterium]
MVDDIHDEANLGEEVDELLEEGLTQKEIESRGYSPSLVRQRIRKRAKAGKETPSTSGRDGGLAIRRQSESVLPEWLEADVAEMFDGNVRDRKIFVSGMTIPLMGLRMFTETVKPLVDLLTAWQKGQAEAAKAAQGSGLELAQAASQATVSQMMPQILDLVQHQSRSGPNPMQMMVMNGLQPLFLQMMGRLTTTLMPQQMPQGQAYQPSVSQPGLQTQPALEPGNSKRVSKSEFEEAWGNE